MNGTQTSSCFNHEAIRIGISFYYCPIFVVTLIGNIIIGIIVYRTRSMRKPINFFIVNMAMSDLLFPIFYFPSIVAKINYGYWLLGGPVGQALCKLNYFLVDISAFVSIQSLVLIAVDRFGAVVFPSTDRKYYHWNYSLQDEIHAKTNQLFYCKHGHVRSVVSDSLFSIHCNRD